LAKIWQSYRQLNGGNLKHSVHSGGEESQRGVGVILDKRTARKVELVRCEGDRLLMVRLRDKQQMWS